MKDTTPEFDRLVERRFQEMTAGERLRICSGMFDSARALAEASFPAGLDERERRRRLCERFYGKLAEKAFPAAAER